MSSYSALPVSIKLIKGVLRILIISDIGYIVILDAAGHPSVGPSKEVILTQGKTAKI